MKENDLARVTWHKSTRSNGSGDCVEVAVTADGVAVRDSKNPNRATLVFTTGTWRAFLDGAKYGEFDC